MPKQLTRTQVRHTAYAARHLQSALAAGRGAYLLGAAAGSGTRAYKRARRDQRVYDIKEKKFFDKVEAENTMAATGEVSTSLNLIPQGVTESTRIGRKAYLHSIDGRCRLNMPETAGQSGGSGDLTLTLVLDKQANGATPAYADIYELNTNVKSFLNLANTGRFKVLWKQEMIFVPVLSGDGTTDATAQTVREAHFHVDLKGLPVEFSGASGAITEITSNNLIMCEISTNASILTNWNYRIRYTD